MRVVGKGRRLARRSVTLLCVIGIMLPLTPGTGTADPGAELDAVRRQLDGARGGLQQIEGRRLTTVTDLADSRERLAALEDKLASLTGELTAAQGSLAAADRTLRATTSELVATEQQLDATRRDLVDARAVFAGRARASYMYGGTGPASSSGLYGVRDATEFHRALAYVQRVVANDRQQVALVGNLERQVQATAADLALLKERHLAERQVAATERDRVAGLVNEQQGLRNAVAAEADRHAAILAGLDADRDAHVALIGSLEAESAELEQELRRRAEEARRAEETRRAEEARRVAAANARRASRSSPPMDPTPVQRTVADWRMPSDGRITSGYGMRRHPIYGTGRMHTGVDFGAPHGAPVYAATAGTIVSAGWRGGYGLAVVIDHGGGLATLYAHASSVSVSPGEAVGRGQVVAATGSTGQSTGPHVHFEVRVSGEPRDPMPYLR